MSEPFVGTPIQKSIAVFFPITWKNMPVCMIWCCTCIATCKEVNCSWFNETRSMHELHICLGKHIGGFLWKNFVYAYHLCLWRKKLCLTQSTSNNHAVPPGRSIGMLLQDHLIESNHRRSHPQGYSPTLKGYLVQNGVECQQHILIFSNPTPYAVDVEAAGARKTTYGHRFTGSSRIKSKENWK